MNYKLIFILLLIALAVLFVVQNIAAVEIQFLFWAVQISRALLIFLLLAVGITIGWFLRGFLKHPEERIGQERKT